MGEELSYLDMAENDYRFLSEDVERGRVGNVLCSGAQNICERYLKHLIVEYIAPDIDTTNILRAHSLKALLRFLENHLPDFELNISVIEQADGYYFSARYPGVDAFLVTKRDVERCWQAVEAAREGVLAYIAKKKSTASKRDS